MGHEEAPLGLSAYVNKAVFFFVVIQEIFEIINLVLFYKVKSQVKMLFNKEASVAISVLITFLRSICRLQLQVIHFHRILFFRHLNTIFYFKLRPHSLVLTVPARRLSLSEVIDRLVLDSHLLQVFFIERGRCSFDFDGLFVIGLRHILLALKAGLGYAVGQAECRLRQRIVEDEGMLIEVDAGFAIAQGVLLVDGLVGSTVLGIGLDDKSNIILVVGFEFGEQAIEQTLKIAFEGVKFDYFCRHRNQQIINLINETNSQPKTIHKPLAEYTLSILLLRTSHLPIFISKLSFLSILKNINMRPTQKPIIIAHRGYCSIFPQNTLESIEAALFKCDLVEFDVLLTKDHHVIIFHDRYLSHITNIAEIEKFKDRRRVASYDADQTEKQKNDWWVRDFTLQELKELKVRQVFSERPQLTQLTFRIPTLQEAINEVLKIKGKQLPENRCGFLVEIKGLWEGQQDQWDKILVEKIADLLQRLDMSCQKICNQKRFPIVLQSFSHHILKTLANTHLNLPVVHLFDKTQPISEQFLAQKLVRNQIGIGITEQHANQAIRQLCNKRQWQIFYWTLRDDQSHKKPFKCNSYREAYHHLIRVGINGIITQFPEKCEEYINELFKA